MKQGDRVKVIVKGGCKTEGTYNYEGKKYDKEWVDNCCGRYAKEAYIQSVHKGCSDGREYGVSDSKEITRNSTHCYFRKEQLELLEHINALREEVDAKI